MDDANNYAPVTADSHKLVETVCQKIEVKDDLANLNISPPPIYTEFNAAEENQSIQAEKTDGVKQTNMDKRNSSDLFKEDTTNQNSSQKHFETKSGKIDQRKRFNWDNVDWNKTNIQIAREMPCDYSTVREQRIKRFPSLNKKEKNLPIEKNMSVNNELSREFTDIEKDIIEKIGSHIYLKTSSAFYETLYKFKDYPNHIINELKKRYYIANYCLDFIMSPELSKVANDYYQNKEKYDKQSVEDCLGLIWQHFSKHIKKDFIKEYLDAYNISFTVPIVETNKSTVKLSNKWLPHQEAVEYARTLGLKSWSEWQAYSKTNKRPKNIPSCPHVIYKNNGWISLANWLGIDSNNDNVTNTTKQFLPFQEAREYVRKQGLKSVRDWQKYSKSGQKPGNIPANPFLYYKNNGWISFMDWLGTDLFVTQNKYVSHKKLNFKPFIEARESAKKFAIELGIKSWDGWYKFSGSEKRPSDIPSRPDKTYKNKGWINLKDWLGL
jgi:hypothetical protein